MQNVKKFNKGDELYRSGLLGIILNGNASVKRLNDMGLQDVIDVYQAALERYNAG